MLKKIMMVIMALACIAPLYSQDKGAAKDGKAAEKKVTVWQEIILEDFETTPYTNRNISYNVTSDQDAKLTVRDQLPAAANSKKYLGLKFKTRGGDIFVIKPAKELIIDKFCKSISFWVYGKKTSGEITFMLQDTKKENHVLMVAQTINFSGWKQITVPLGKKINQEDDFLNQKKTMKIINIQYRSATTRGKPSQWEYLYLDDITATVRERYDDKQSDEW